MCGIVGLGSVSAVDRKLCGGRAVLVLPTSSQWARHTEGTGEVFVAWVNVRSELILRAPAFLPSVDGAFHRTELESVSVGRPLS